MKSVSLLFSGGRDSFLSACRLVEDGYRVYLITYENGCMSNLSSVSDTADRLIAKYGSSRIGYLGVRSCKEVFRTLRESMQSNTLRELAQSYPYLVPYQTCCLACHTAMYVESIGLCRKHGISYLADGGRPSQQFFVELPEMMAEYEMLARSFGLELLFPVSEITDDFVCKLELADRGFVPKVAEPQCWLGCPVRQVLLEDQKQSLLSYYQQELKPLVRLLCEERLV